MKFELSLDGGKYTYRFNDGGQEALRYGEPWRDLTGDNLVYWLAVEVRSYREACGDLAIPDDAPPGVIADAVSYLERMAHVFHMEGSSGDEARRILKALGRPAMEMKGDSAPVSPEKCIVCGGDEPCSHDFDKMNADLAEIGSRMGTANPAPEPEGYYEKCRRETAEYHAAKQAAVHPEPEPPKVYVHLVPDHCDRITWRGGYQHLPLDGKLVLTPAEKQLVLGLVEAGIATHDDLPPGDNIFRRKSEEMLPVYQSIKSKLETP